MVDDDGVGTSFRLRAFTGVVDDEGINQGQVAQNQVRVAGGGEPDALTGQPFERAVFPHMHDSISLEAMTQPVIRAQVMMGGHEVRRVVDGNGILPKAPWRLNANKDIAKL